MKYKSVLFDMDGTVLNTIDDLRDAVNHVLEKYGYPAITTEQCARNLGNGAKVLLEKSAPEGTVTEEMLEYYKKYYDAHCRIKTAPYPGILKLMETLKEQGVKMAIISNKPDTATKELSNIFFKGLVDFAVGESATVKRKPDPSAVLAACDHFGLKKEECVYIGDTEVDLATGVNASMDVIAVLWGFRTREELIASGAKILVSNADELLQTIIEE